MKQTAQQLKLRKQFIKVWRRSAVPILQEANFSNLDALYNEALKHLPFVSADVPDLKSTPVTLRPALIGSLNMIVLYKVLHARGSTDAEIGQLCTDIVEHEVRRIPGWMVKLTNWFMFTGLALKQGKKEAKRLKNAPSNQFRLAVYGEPGVLKMDITQCAICHISARHNASNFTPYICKVDQMLSEKLRWGLKRTQTIAGGANHCDFIFVKGASTQIER